MRSQLQLLVQKKAVELRIDYAFVAAIIDQESRWRPYASRYEAKTATYLVDADSYARLTAVSRDTECMGQMTSWGLMQVMGFVARELGFKGLLPELCQPELGITYGVMKLKQLEQRFGKPSVVQGWDEAVVAAYNFGHPQKDADGVWTNDRYVRSVEQKYLELAGQT